MIVYHADQELPALAFVWSDGNGNVIDFSIGYMFTVKVCATGTTTTLLTKTSGITGALIAPNVLVDWSTTDFAALPAPATYQVHLYARRTSDSKDRVFSPGNPPAFSLVPAPT